MTVLVQSTFVGSNGSAWPSPWVGELQGGTSGGAVDIQSNRGRLRAHDGGYQVARALADGVTVSNVLVEATVSFPTVTEQYVYPVVVRGSGSWQSTDAWRMTSGYTFYLGLGYADNREVAIRREDGGGADTVLADALLPASVTANTDYRVKFEASGSTLRAKMWPASGSEPGWQMETTDATYGSGAVAVSLLSGATAGSRDARFDEFTVTSLGAVVLEPSAWSGWSFTTTPEEGGAPPPEPEPTTPEWRVLHQGVPVPALLFSAGDLE